MMQEPLTTTRQPDSRPDRMPKLSYRNTFPPESKNMDGGDVVTDKQPTTEQPDEQSKPGRLTIRQIRESMAIASPNTSSPETPAWNSPPGSPVEFQPPPKKKSSFFSGLFTAKEPTQVALNQVAAQMMAQHGSTSATKVPNVSLEKMPAYVPKVNSKWDGVPEAIKMREKMEKEHQRAWKRQSNTPSSDSNEFKFGEHCSRSSFSASNSDYREVLASNTSQTSSPINPNPHKFYAISVNSSGDLVSQQRQYEMSSPPYRPRSTTRSSSGTPFASTTVTTASKTLREPQGLAIDHGSIAQNRDQPARDDDVYQETEEPLAAEHSIDTNTSESDYRSSGSTNSSIIDESETDQIEKTSTSKSIQKPVQYITPSSAAETPVLPPIHEIHHPESEVETPSLENSDTVALSTPTTRQSKNVKTSNAAFLAGEARPFELPDEQTEKNPSRTMPIPTKIDTRRSPDIEKRPDTSRERLGLRASMVVQSNIVPWETMDVPEQNSLQRSATTKSGWQPGQTSKRSKKFGIF